MFAVELRQLLIDGRFRLPLERALKLLDGGRNGLLRDLVTVRLKVMLYQISQRLFGCAHGFPRSLATRINRPATSRTPARPDGSATAHESALPDRPDTSASVRRSPVPPRARGPRAFRQFGSASSTPT